MKVQIGLFNEDTTEFLIQRKIKNFFEHVSFDKGDKEVLRIYSIILKKQQLKFGQLKSFYKLDTYEQDRDKYNKVMLNIRKLLSSIQA
jgi:hypothetical protein